MSERTSQPVASDPLGGKSEPGYIRASHADANAVRYLFRFYSGFARRLEFQAPGESGVVTLYQQPPGVSFEVGPGGPESVSTLDLVSTSGMAVELQIDATPEAGDPYPINRFQIYFQPYGKPWAGTGRVQPLRGAEWIREIVVYSDRRSESGGGVYGMANGSGLLTVQNESNTCPPDCDPPPP